MESDTRILLVEDNHADAELNKREANKVLKKCSFKLVETEEAFLDALIEWQPHLVLSDYSMPAFDGLTALALTLKHAPDTPVIMVTGSVNEDTAVECMKAGAVNYVIKQSIKRLGTAILHALEERERKIEHIKAQNALLVSEKRYRSLFEISPVGIVVQNADNVIINVNEAYCNISGYNKDQLIGRKVSNLALSNDELNNIENNTARILSGETLRHEVRNLCSDGTAIYIELTESAIELSDGSMGIMSIANDITERKTAEEALRQQADFQQRLMDAIPIPVFYKDVSGVYQGCNNAFETFMGIKKDDLKGKTVFDVYPAQIAEAYFQTDNLLLKQGGKQNYEYFAIDANGIKHDIIFSKATYVGANGQTSGLIGSMFDISDRKSIEENLKQRNRDLQFLSDYALKLTDLPGNADITTVIMNELKILTEADVAIISKYDKNENALYASNFVADPEIIKIIEESLGGSINNFKTPLNNDIHNLLLSETFAHYNTLTELTFGQIPEETDKKFKLLTGINHFAGLSLFIADELYGTVVIGLNKDKPEPDPEMLRSFAYLSSLTLRRKKAEEELKEREERLRKIVDSSQDAMIIMDAKGFIYLWNYAAEKMFGYKAEEVLGRNLHQLISPDRYLQTHQEAFQKYILTGQGNAIGKLIELEGLKRDGTEFPIELALSAINIDDSWFSVGAIRDITERKKAEATIIRSEKRYHDLFDANKDGISVILISPEDKASKFLVVNEKAATMLGLSREHMINIPPENLEVEIDGQTMNERRNRLISDGSYTFETRLIHKSGKTIPVEISASFVNFDGTPAILNITRDISERKFRDNLRQMQYNIANAVITANSLYDLYEAVRTELSEILDTTNFFVAFYNQESKMMYAPFEKEEKEVIKEWPAEKSLTGYVVKQQKTVLLRKKEISELAEKGKINLIGHRSEIWLGTPIYNGKTVIGAMVVQSYTNPEAYNEDSKYVIELAAHELSSYIGRKEAEQNALKLSKAIEQNPVSIVITDRDGIIDYVNPKFTEVTGYSLQEAIGMRPSILKSGIHDNSFYENLWNTITSGNNWQGEIKNKKKDGSYYWENAIISPIIDEQGVITHYVAVKEDITEKKKIIKELEIAKERAEESDRLKTAFLQNISHEIRTPLNGILGFSELLIQDWTTPEERIDFNESIQLSGKRLIEIVNNVLDISIIETGQIILSPTHFKLNSALMDLYNFYKLQFQNKSIAFAPPKHCKDDDFTICADQGRIHQVLTNLLNNAFKYTKTGEVSFGYKCVGEELIFEVSDTGIGIDKSHFGRIFTRFYQAENSSARNYEGAGLGLSISHGLVMAMGGKIWFESEPGKGTTFYFSIPVTHQTRELNPSQKETSDSSDIILIADDDETSYLLLQTVLKRRGINVARAETGNEAVKLIKDNHRIKLIFMDVKMPEMDGLEATRIIKTLKPEIPVIIQTAFAFNEDMEAAFAAGGNEYLSKPISSEKISAVLDKYLIKA
ncbi:MAG: PAS domain S-box protein [Lentimicrobiaceae bacterium]|nr:PAS domain S-box protein [Lentimicrobiaceae bacterium]